eukprot:scaffold11561_cov151-Cylindrotheca_fusiformis.AAC.4
MSPMAVVLKLKDKRYQWNINWPIQGGCRFELVQSIACDTEVNSCLSIESSPQKRNVTIIKAYILL